MERRDEAQLLNDNVTLTIMLFMKSGMFCDSLFLSLNRYKDLRVVAQVSTLEALNVKFRIHGTPNIIILDAGLDGLHEICSMIRLLIKKTLHTRIIVVAPTPSSYAASHLIEAGALAYIPRDARLFVLKEAFPKVMQGEVTTTPDIVAEITQHRLSDQDLTDREMDIAICVARGMRNNDIARCLLKKYQKSSGASPETINVMTVKKHLDNIFKKLGIHSRAELMSYIYRNGVIPITEITKLYDPNANATAPRTTRQRN